MQQAPLEDFEPEPTFAIRDDVPAVMFDPEPEAEPQVDDGHLDEFPSDIARPLHGLMHLGKLSTEVELLGHSFVMRTLKIGEELAVGEITGEYEGQLGLQKAFATASVAACLVSVDGQALTKPLGPQDTSDAVRARFKYVRDNWYWPVVEELYGHYGTLNDRMLHTLRAVEGKSAAGRRTSKPSAGSQNDRAFFAAT